MSSSVFLLASALLLSALGHATAWDQNCIKHAVGFGHSTTGAKGEGEVVTVTSPEELRDALCKDIDQRDEMCLDSEPRTIIIDGAIDFRKKNITEVGCIYNRCGNKGFQYSLRTAGSCEGKTLLNVTLDEAGTRPIIVGSNKYIVGKNLGEIVGTGLWLKNVSNVFIENIKIHQINPHVVWGGDAIALVGVQDVVIHRVTFKDIGRQMLVTYQAVNKGVTVSSCTFNGNTDYSVYCNKRHYWTMLFWGTDDEITLVNNHIHDVLARAPHVGGWAVSNNKIHLINNVFDNVGNHAIEARTGSRIFAEGNLFRKVRKLFYEKSFQPGEGAVFMARENSNSTACEEKLGRACAPNILEDTAEVIWEDEAVLEEFSSLDPYIADTTELQCPVRE